MTVLIITVVTNRLLYGIINNNDRTNRGIEHYYNDNNVDTDEVESDEKSNHDNNGHRTIYRNSKIDDSFEGETK